MRAGRPWKWISLSCFGDPTSQTLVFGKEVEDRVVGRRYVRLLTGERSPAERTLALAEERSYVSGNETGIAVSAVEASELRLPAQRVAVIEDLGAALFETHHRDAVAGHRGSGFRDVALRIVLAQLGCLAKVVARRDVARERVVGGGLVRDGVWDVASLQERRKHLRRVAEDADGERLPRPLRLLGTLHGLVEVVDAFVQVTVGDSTVYPVRVYLDAQGYALVHGDGQWLGAAHAAEAGREADAAPQRTPEALFCHCGERFVGTLEDALGP